VKHQATGKIFEYLASGTPILALAPTGEASRIIQETGTGFTVDPGDEEGIREVLTRSYDAYQKGRLITTERAEGEIASYSRAALTEKLAGILNEVSAEGD
jgi:glycosyltransferase involved in cell wall biosynthesis